MLEYIMEIELQFTQERMGNLKKATVVTYTAN